MDVAGFMRNKDVVDVFIEYTECEIEKEVNPEVTYDNLLSDRVPPSARKRLDTDILEEQIREEEKEGHRKRAQSNPDAER